MPYDAILILGGGVREGGVLTPWVEGRFDCALAIPGHHFFVASSAGTTHRPPPLDARGFPIFETFSGARYLVEHGIHPHRILTEASSWDTIGNAYFSRVIHAIPRGFQRLLVVTSAFHMPRSEAIFRWVYSLPGPGGGCSLDFLASPDRGIDPAVLARRVDRERASLEIVRRLEPRLDSLAALHAWLFSEHGIYRALPTAPSGPPADPATY